MTAIKPTTPAPNLPVVEMIRNVYADSARRLTTDWGQMFGHIQTLLSIIDELHASSGEAIPDGGTFQWSIKARVPNGDFWASYGVDLNETKMREVVADLTAKGREVRVSRRQVGPYEAVEL